MVSICVRGPGTGGSSRRSEQCCDNRRAGTAVSGRCRLGLVNPLTGEGMLHALVSGSLAGAAAAGGGGAHAANTYRRTLHARLGGHHSLIGRAVPLLNRPGIIDLGVRACRRDPAMFDRLVRIGLGTEPLSAIGMLRLLSALRVR